jgi:tagatose 1,6-diphosphate aldolase
VTHFPIAHHLNQCSGPTGTFGILAIDHRGNLVEEMTKARGKAPGFDDVVAFKRSAIHHLADVSSAVLTDPDYGFPALVECDVPSSCGLIAPLEVTNYGVHPSRRKMRFIKSWSVAQAKKAGCSGVKLLLYYHPEAKNTRRRTRLVERVAEECRRHAIPFFLETIAYSLDPDASLSGNERQQVVIETARHFSRRGPDVLKLEFPLDPKSDERRWPETLKALDEACAVPWTLLSGGVSFEAFLKQATAACRAGASGVMVGRAVWGEAVKLRGDALETFMQTTARERMQALSGVCHLYGRPWHDRIPRPVLKERWYVEGP